MFDSDTGLQNNLHRWYDPNSGRWISEDPIGFAAGDANLYRYVGNSPISLTDPNGEAAQWHHLLPQQFRKRFEAAGFTGLNSIDASHYGWIIDSQYHQAGGCGPCQIHPQWNKDWEKFWTKHYPEGTTPSPGQVLEYLGKLKNKHNVLLSRGVQAAMTHREWLGGLNVMKAAIKATKASKCGKKAALGKIVKKIGKPLTAITFVYVAATDSVAIAAEGATRDALWPFIDMAEQAGKEVGVHVDGLQRSGDLKRCHFETIANGLRDNPCGATIPMTPGL